VVDVRQVDAQHPLAHGSNAIALNPLNQRQNQPIAQLAVALVSEAEGV
jgi:hypothetical protein